MTTVARVLIISFTIFIAAFCAAGFSIWTLYNVSREEQTARLVELAQSQARMMEAISGFIGRQGDAPDSREVRDRTLEWVRESHSNFRGFGDSGEFTLAERQDDLIVFLLSHRHSDLDQPHPVEFYSDIAEPMRRALSGYSGNLIGLDYRGEMVLAAHEPVAGLDMGIVAKIDLAEVRSPFISATIVSFTACAVIILLCVGMAYSILIPMIDEANRASQEKTDFLARMSHEFRTPLNAIIGFSEIMKKQMLGVIENEKYREYAEDIYYSGNHMLELVNDVLDISAIESGNRELEKEELDLPELIADIVRNFESITKTKGLRISLDVPRKIPRFKADRRSMVQIVNNILSNACKYSHEGGLVSVSADCEDDAVIIKIEDRGEGIPPNDLPNIFDRFTQAQGNPEISKEGTGLGLSIVKSLVEAHQGHVEIESTLEEGTTVTVVLPLLPETGRIDGFLKKSRVGL